MERMVLYILPNGMGFFAPEDVPENELRDLIRLAENANRCGYENTDTRLIFGKDFNSRHLTFGKNFNRDFIEEFRLRSLNESRFNEFMASSKNVRTRYEKDRTRSDDYKRNEKRQIKRNVRINQPNKSNYR